MDVAAYMDLAYTKVVTRDEDSDCFIAEVRELPGCVAHGSSEAEALEILREAQHAWIDGVLKQGKQPPLPRTELPSGKWVQRVPRSLHKRLVDLADAEDTSLNQLVTAMLSEAVAKRAMQAPARRWVTAPHHGWDPPGVTGQRMNWHAPDVSVRFMGPLREKSATFEEVQVETHIKERNAREGR